METVKLNRNSINVKADGTTEISNKDLANKVSADPSYITKLVGHSVDSLKPADVQVDSLGRVIIKNADFASKARKIIGGMPEADDFNLGIVCGGDHHLIC
ncbi:hypothetical protein ACVDG5_010740 [Mesorhizobium sp. ORM6]